MMRFRLMYGFGIDIKQMVNGKEIKTDQCMFVFSREIFFSFSYFIHKLFVSLTHSNLST